MDRGRFPANVRGVVAVVLLSVVAVGHAKASGVDGERPDAVPNRPTVSNPAQLSAPMWLEGEFGGLWFHDRHADDGPERRASLPYSLKLAFTEDWGVRIDGEAVARATATDGSHETGVGDTTFIVKRRFAVGDDSAFGLEAGPTIPTARRGLSTGSGKPDWAGNGIYSADLAAWHTDLNLIGTRVGAHASGQARLQTLAAAALSHPFLERWTAAGEFSGTRQHGVPSTAQALGALSYAIRRDLVVDFGAAHALNRATPTWQAFGGVTVVIGRVD